MELKCEMSHLWMKFQLPDFGIVVFFLVCCQFVFFSKRSHQLRLMKPVSYPLRYVEVACLRFYVMGFRGDWKAYRQVFNLERHYNTDEASSNNKRFNCLKSLMFPAVFFLDQLAPKVCSQVCFKITLRSVGFAGLLKEYLTWLCA